MDDAELVARARTGDPGAFEELVTRHHAACLRYAAHLLGDRTGAEDVVQDTWVRAYRSLGRYEERSQFRSWLFRILVNRCRTSFGRRRKVPTTGITEVHAVVNDEVHTLELRSQLARALASLDGPH